MLKKLVKDLLYNQDNQHLDISRVSSLLGVFTYLGATFYHIFQGNSMDFVAWGGGWTALCAGCGGWIYMRQKYESENKNDSIS